MSVIFVSYQYKFWTLVQISIFVLTSIIFFTKISHDFPRARVDDLTFLEVLRIFLEMLEGIADTKYTAAWLRKQCVDDLRTSNLKISRVSRQRRSNEFFLFGQKTLLVNYFRKWTQKVRFYFPFFKIRKTWKFGHRVFSGGHEAWNLAHF